MCEKPVNSTEAVWKCWIALFQNIYSASSKWEHIIQTSQGQGLENPVVLGCKKFIWEPSVPHGWKAKYVRMSWSVTALTDAHIQLCFQVYSTCLSIFLQIENKKLRFGLEQIKIL